MGWQAGLPAGRLLSHSGQEERALPVAPQGPPLDDAAGLLPTFLSSSVWSQDGSVRNTCPPPEESSQGQPDDRKDLPWDTPLQLPPVLLETDRSAGLSSPGHAPPCPGFRKRLANGVMTLGSQSLRYASRRVSSVPLLAGLCEG